MGLLSTLMGYLGLSAEGRGTKKRILPKGGSSKPAIQVNSAQQPILAPALPVETPVSHYPQEEQAILPHCLMLIPTGLLVAAIAAYYFSEKTREMTDEHPGYVM